VYNLGGEADEAVHTPSSQHIEGGEVGIAAHHIHGAASYEGTEDEESLQQQQRGESGEEIKQQQDDEEEEGKKEEVGVRPLHRSFVCEREGGARMGGCRGGGGVKDEEEENGRKEAEQFLLIEAG
jgi:hypothetical protein